MRIARRRHRAVHLITRAEKARLRELIERVEQETTGEICVVLLQDVEDPADFARRYFDHLGVGKRELDNGMLILVVVAKRRIEIVVGKGLKHVAPQAFLEQVVNDILVPDFRAGKFADGLHKAVEAFGRVLHEHRPKVRPGESGTMPRIIDLSQDQSHETH